MAKCNQLISLPFKKLKLVNEGDRIDLKLPLGLGIRSDNKLMLFVLFESHSDVISF